MPPDCAKDANMEASVTCRVLELIKDKFFRDSPHAMPRCAEIHTDNTAREGVNQTFCTFLAAMLALGCFEDINMPRLEKDHTHNELDQLFSALGAYLQSAECLETPDEFCDFLLKHVRPHCGRELHVEVMTDCWDFNSFFHCLDIHIKGLTPTVANSETNHVWRFLQRDLVHSFFQMHTLRMLVQLSVQWSSVAQTV